jgi:hypothetical protein
MTTHRRHVPADVDPAALDDSGGASYLPGGHGAALGYFYLCIPIVGIGPAIVIYLVNRRRSAFARAHAAQALRASCAAALYDFCFVIIGGLLALDSVRVAGLTAGPLALALWLVIVVLAVRATHAARLGQGYQFPRWLRV